MAVENRRHGHASPIRPITNPDAQQYGVTPGRIQSGVGAALCHRTPRFWLRPNGFSFPPLRLPPMLASWSSESFSGGTRPFQI